MKGSYAEKYAKDVVIFSGDGTFPVEIGAPFIDGSGTNIFGTAQIWVNYNLGDSNGTWQGPETLLK